MKRIRPIVLAAAAVALTVTSAWADNGSTALNAAPAKTMMALHFNAQRLSKSPLFKDVMAQARKNPEFKKGLGEMESKLGFNPERDLTGLTVFIPTDVSAGGKPTIIATGTFNVAKASAEASKDKSFTKSTIANQQAFIGKDGMGMVFSKGKIVIGPQTVLKQVWSGAGGKAASLSKLSNTVDRSKDVWFAANLPADLKAKMGNNDPMSKDIDTLRGSLDLATGLGLRLNVGVSKAATATKLASMANAQLTKAKADAGKNPMMGAMGLGAVLNKLAVVAKGNDVAVNLDLNQAEVGQIKNMAMMMMGGMAAGAKGAPAKPGK